ncbi:MitMSS1 [Forsythia ovata]|uniref:MitMSS1 n=1 Tax=Forsythia ovata TaxID=205694 RepID=A0ABD1WXL8_9LAMI
MLESTDTITPNDSAASYRIYDFTIFSSFVSRVRGDKGGPAEEVAVAEVNEYGQKGISLKGLMRNPCLKIAFRKVCLRSLANFSSIETRQFYDSSRGKNLEGKASMSYKAESNTKPMKESE